MKAKKAAAPSAREKLDAFGVESVCRDVMDGELLAQIARSIEVSKSQLVEWIAADPERSARVREARRASAFALTETALASIRDAADPFELAKAKEEAHHLRWVASKMNPRELGEKIAIGGADDLPPIKTMSDDQLAARIAALQERLHVKPG